MNANAALTATKCPPTIGLQVSLGLVGLYGPEWLSLRLGNGLKFYSCVLVLGEMLRRSIERKADEIPLSSAWLRGLVGDEMRRTVLPLLMRVGALEPAGVWAPWYFRKTHTYRFTKEYSSQPMGEVKLSPKLLLRYKTYHSRLLKETLSAAPIYQTLWDDLQHLTLHSSWVEGMPMFSAGQWRKEWSWLSSADRITRRDYYFTCARAKSGVSALPGRLYTTFCSTPAALRKYALLDGAPLACIDVKASQPYLHATLIPESSEKVRYLELVKSGRFYEEIAAAGAMKETCRDKIKQDVFSSIFYGKNVVAERTTAWAAFRTLFPSLSEAIKAEKLKDHSALSIKMQFLESNIILHTAVPALKQLEPKARVLTVHDALYVRTEYVPSALKCLEKAFQEHTGDSPNFKVEDPSSYTKVPCLSAS